MLLKKGANHDVPDRDGATPIHYAGFEFLTYFLMKCSILWKLESFTITN